MVREEKAAETETARAGGDSPGGAASSEVRHDQDSAPRLGWGHINLNVRSLEASIEFYAKLGFEVFIPGVPYLALTAESPPEALPDECAAALGLPNGTTGRACILQLGNGFPKLDLTEFSLDEAAPPLSNGDLGFVRLCLASQDLESDYRRLCDQGVEFLSAPTEGQAGMALIALCRDPDGALIELIELRLDRFQARA